MTELRHRLRHVHLDDLAGRPERRLDVGDRRQLRALRQRAEHMIERAAERLGIDVADHGDRELVAGKHAPQIAMQIVAGDGGDGGLGALDRASIRVIAEGETIPGKRSDLLGVVLVELQSGDDLAAHALDRIRIEARLRHGETQQLERLILVGGEHLHIAEHHVAARIEIHARGERLQALLEGDQVEVAGAFVHHAGHEIGEALPVLRVLCGAAAEGEAHGDQGIGVALDEPGLDAAGTDDALDLHGVSRTCGERRQQRDGGKPRLPHGA